MASYCVLWCYGAEQWRARGGELWVAALAAPGESWSIHDVTAGDYPSPAQLAACTGLVITGSPSAAYDAAPWIAALLDFIRASVAQPGGPRILGGCFGAQALCAALGGTVKPTGSFILRAEAIAAPPGAAPPASSPAPQLAALLAAPGGVRLLEAHGDACAALPPGAALLGASPSCAHEVFCVPDAAGAPRALGVQGHPEFELEDALQRVWPRVQHRLSAGEQEAARASFALPRQEREVCAALKAWLAGGSRGAGGAGGAAAL
jgi:GMP synthase-like glutamine amidotransferase